MKSETSIAVCGSSQFGQSTSTNDICIPVEFSINAAKKIKTGGWHSVVLCSNDLCAFWGSNSDRQIPKVQSILIRSPASYPLALNYSDIALGSKHTVLLQKTGTLKWYGSNQQGQQPPNGLANIQKIFAKFEETAVVVTPNRVMIWGNNKKQTNIDFPKEEIISHIELSPKTTSILCESGNLYIYEDSINTAKHDDVISVASSRQNTIYLHKSGNIFGIYKNKTIKIAGIPEFPIKVFAGGAHFGCVTLNGKCFTWGFGGRGQLGNGLFANNSNPQLVIIDDKKRVIDACAGEEHTVLLLAKEEHFLPSIPQAMQGKIASAEQFELSRDFTFDPPEFDIKF